MTTNIITNKSIPNKPLPASPIQELEYCCKMADLIKNAKKTNTEIFQTIELLKEKFYKKYCPMLNSTSEDTLVKISQIQIKFANLIDEIEKPILTINNLINHLESNVKEEGIFRVSGSATEIAELKKNLAKNPSFNLKGIKNPHVVACALKQLLRELDLKLLITQQPALLNAKDPQSIKDAIAKLPSEYHKTLKSLIELFTKVMAEPTSKMTSDNLAITFAPTFFETELNEVADSIRVIKMLVENKDAIFS